MSIYFFKQSDRDLIRAHDVLIKSSPSGGVQLHFPLLAE